MDQKLENVQRVLLRLDPFAPGQNRGRLEDISNLVLSLESSTSCEGQNDAELAPAIARLPREILLRIAELVRIPQELGLETHDQEEDENANDGLDMLKMRRERSISFTRRTNELLRLALQIVQMLPRTESQSPEPTTLADDAALFVSFSKFRQPEFASPFSTNETKQLTSQLVTTLLNTPAASSRLALLSYVLRNVLPTRFKPNPKLHPSSGRVLNRPLGGPRGTDDWQEQAAEEGGWKREIGLSGTVADIIRNLKIEELEDLWPLLLPPILSYLDDFAPTNKILGLHLLDSLLDLFVSQSQRGASSSLLIRTGVGKVFRKSLTVIFSNLSDPLSLRLQSLSQPVSLKLINLLYPPPVPNQLPVPSTSTQPPNHVRLPIPSSPARDARLEHIRRDQSRTRFEALCEHFQETVLTVWQYKPDHYDFELLQMSDACGILPWVEESFRTTETTTKLPTTTTTTTPTTTKGIEGGKVVERGGGEVIRYLGILIPHLTGMIRGPGQGVMGGGEGGGGGEENSRGLGFETDLGGKGVWNDKFLNLRLRGVLVLRHLVRKREVEGTTDGPSARTVLRNRIIKSWEDTIVASMATCWIGLKEDPEVGNIREGKSGGREVLLNLETELRGLVNDLKDDDNGNPQQRRRDYWKELQELDPLFEDLVQWHP